MFIPMTVSAANLTESRITSEMALWACLGRLALIALVDTGRPMWTCVNHGWDHRLYKWGRGSECQHTCICCSYLLWRHCGHSHAALPSMPRWTPPLKCEPGYVHFPLSWFCQSILLHQQKKKLSLPLKLLLSILTKLTIPPWCPTEICSSLADPGSLTYFSFFFNCSYIQGFFVCLLVCLLLVASCHH